MTRPESLGTRLYHGDVSVDFVGRRRIWYAAAVMLLLLTALSLGIRGLDFGVEFTGGSVFTFESSQATTANVTQATTSALNASSDEVIVQEVSGDRWRVQTETLTPHQLNQVQASLSDHFGLSPQAISPQSIGPSWGEQISQKALIGIAVFLALVVVYLSISFEWKMAVAALIALVHDIIATVGIYALVGFVVTPATVIGLLTILGYSLYDTVVVFDKVRENTAGLLGGARMTFSQAANRAVNQVLLRSINTSVIALLPVAAILFIGAGLLGAGTLKDLSLVLLIGMAVGTYSSIFLATPLLTEFKEREPQMRALARRVAARQGGASKKRATKQGTTEQGAMTAGSGAASDRVKDDDTQGAEQASGGERGGEGDPAGVGAPAPGRVVREGARQQPKRGSKRRPSGKKKR